MTQRIELTQGGYARLQQTLEHEYRRLEEARRVVQEQMHANENESLGLAEAQRELLATQERITDIEETLSHAVLIEASADGASQARLGSVVVLLDVGSGRELRLQLVSPPEASALAGQMPRVSTESPVGRALLGRAMGEIFEVNLGKRQASYRVVSITA
ncbi:GreA/GreB family elongation factor [Deinococcus yavapaiensis]|uniref:Transcription elongation factor GreA n=1 Tax=Deinococcus yavapaiensis KR-236 TaxID=694435 RepID=A0A318SFT2_9DEIO|nr:GreA/GreB family elongation factor [Deinococcus yavapaiensis]PYE47926.1 transcription elongation factor GreA [Deinococcus yavapaiensis KR-236]